MQTAIHFEGDLAYICVSDQGEIKEEEPVTYGRSRVEFVISTAQAQKEGTIGVVLDEAAPQIVQQAEEQCIRAGITKERVRFFTKEEAALGVVGFRGDNLLRGNSVILITPRNDLSVMRSARQKIVSWLTAGIIRNRSRMRWRMKRKISHSYRSSNRHW